MVRLDDPDATPRSGDIWTRPDYGGEAVMVVQVDQPDPARADDMPERARPAEVKRVRHGLVTFVAAVAHDGPCRCRGRGRGDVHLGPDGWCLPTGTSTRRGRIRLDRWSLDPLLRDGEG